MGMELKVYLVTGAAWRPANELALLLSHVLGPSKCLDFLFVVLRLTGLVDIILWQLSPTLHMYIVLSSPKLCAGGSSPIYSFIYFMAKSSASEFSATNTQ